MHEETRELLEEKLSSTVVFVVKELSSRATDRLVTEAIRDMIDDMKSVSFDVLHHKPTQSLISRFPDDAREITGRLINMQPESLRASIRLYMKEIFAIDCD